LGKMEYLDGDFIGYCMVGLCVVSEDAKGIC